MSITTKAFGNEHHGYPVTEYTLKNKNGAYVSIIDFGGTITKIVVPDKNGNLTDVNLGFDNAMAYTSDSGSMGALIGRIGNRIANATFNLEGKQYTLGANNGPNNLHGGPEGFNVRMWETKAIESENEDTLSLSLTSPDNDQGFPGELKVNVKYIFDSNNKLTIEYCATTNKTTIVNLTNHAYFNLDGHTTPTVENLELQVFAKHVTQVREGLIPTGKLIPQNEVAYDFSQNVRIGDILAKTQEDADMKAAGGVDFNYCAGKDKQMKLIASLYSPKTGIKMDVNTDLPGVQVYTGQGLHQKGKEGTQYKPYSGVCLETQRYPDAINHDHFPSVVLNPKEVYYTKTEYAFSISK